MPTSEDEHPIQHLTPHRADPSLGVGVGPRRQLLVIRKVRQVGCG
jgi:hypothetical protein